MIQTNDSDRTNQKVKKKKRIGCFNISASLKYPVTVWTKTPQWMFKIDDTNKKETE